MPSAELRPAVFLDRDGTLIREKEYLADPGGVELIHGAATALHRLKEAGFLLVVVTNQSGIARGYFPESAYHAVAARVDELLAADGARVDAVYFCPHHPEHGEVCDCRKPGLGLFRRAAAELGIDLPRSFWIGDRLSDVAPAAALGGQGILVRTGYGAAEAAIAPAELAVVSDITAAADAIIGHPGAVDIA